MKRITNKIISFSLITTFLVGGISGCGTSEEKGHTDNINENTSIEQDVLTKDGNLPIEDNKGWYANWDSNEVVTMYLTVREGNEDDGTNHTWDEINAYSAYYYEDMGIDRYKVEGLLQVGDENGPVIGELGYGQHAPNSIVQIRGQTSTQRAQKNYRISIRDGKGDWEGMTTINLNKHQNDYLRFNNMLAYNLMQDVDGMMSARTKFVHLYVKDQTGSGMSDTFVDYGLYTFVEQINKTYLRNHGLDRNGHLYKINFFEFYPYEDVIMLKSDVDYDVTEFEKYIEIKGNDDHSKLIQMLQELNDYTIPIEEVFAKWFDEENYFSWLAFHILMGNKDTQSRNFFLYSPSNVNKFYFISWDNDGSLMTNYTELKGYKQGLEYEEGITNYWGSVLHRRVFQSELYREKLDEKINEIRNILTKEKIETLGAQYAATIRPYLYRLPDINYALLTQSEYNAAVNDIYHNVEVNYSRYQDSLKKSMPFFLGTPYVEDGALCFNWDASFDLDQETVRYKFELSKGYTFRNVMYAKEDMLETNVSIAMLPPGQYFYRVTATNESGYTQTAFDYYNSDRGKEYGMVCFWIMEDGSIVLDTYVEGE